MNELVTIEPQNALKLFTTENGLDPILEKLKKEADDFIADVSTKKGRDEIASFAYRFAKSKTYLDGVGKKLVDDLKKQPKLIDAERSRVWNFVESLQTKVRQPLTDWELIEENRVNQLKLRLQSIGDYLLSAQNLSASDLQKMINILGDLSIDESWQEFEEEAKYKKSNVLLELNKTLTIQKQREHDAAELARLQAAEKARLEEEEKERLRKEGEERARLQAEESARIEREAAEQKQKKEKEDAEKREAEQLAAIETAKREKAEAELRAANAEKAAKEKAEYDLRKAAEDEKAAEEKREANKRHVKMINNQAAAAFINDGFSEAQAKQAVTLIAKGLVPNVSIKY